MATRDMHMTSPFSTLVLRLQHVFMMHAGVVPGYIDIAKIAALVHHYVNCDDARKRMCCTFHINVWHVNSTSYRL